MRMFKLIEVVPETSARISVARWFSGKGRPLEKKVSEGTYGREATFITEDQMREFIASVVDLKAGWQYKYFRPCGKIKAAQLMLNFLKENEC